MLEPPPEDAAGVKKEAEDATKTEPQVKEYLIYLISREMAAITRVDADVREMVETLPVVILEPVETDLVMVHHFDTHRRYILYKRTLRITTTDFEQLRRTLCINFNDVTLKIIPV